MRRRLPRVSLGTVYRNLRRLAAEGLLLERTDEKGLRFDANLTRHDHFTCLQVGRYLSFVFENRETVWFQIQEMVRAERIVDDGKIAEEVEVYNDLLPRPGELAATMMIEIGESAEIKPVLDRLLGIDTRDYVRLEIGPHVVVGRFEAGRSDEELGKISAVHFVHFPLPTEARRMFSEAEVTLVVDHPNERVRTVLSPETKRSLAEDLA